MTARFSPDPPLAAASSWAGRKPPPGNVSYMPPLPRSSAARDAVIADLKAQAKPTGLMTLKQSARAYLAHPSQLNYLRRGYDAAYFTPDQLIEFGRELLREEVEAARGRLQFVPVKQINAKAAIMVGRYRRRFGERV